MKVPLVALALVVVGCGPSHKAPAPGTNASELWLAPNGSDVNLYLSDVEPEPF